VARRSTSTTASGSSGMSSPDRGHAFGYGRMIGNHPISPTPSPTVAVPGDHLCGCQHPVHPSAVLVLPQPRIALPLIALQYHGSRSFEFRDASELVVRAPTTPWRLGATLCRLCVSRHRRAQAFAQVTHEYLIEQLQFTGSESIPMNQENVKIKLNFNHPVKGTNVDCARQR
jgi:hypothetical protein